MSKEKRIKQFEDLSIQIKQAHLNLEPAENFIDNNQQKLTKDFDLSNISWFEESVVETMQRFDNAAVLVFASAKNPGGGVLNGSVAQEETISLHSTWYFQAKENKDFYSEKYASALNTDKVSVAKGYLMTDTYGYSIVPKNISFIACAAPNLKGITQQKSNISEEKIYEEADKRIKKILSAAVSLKCEHLILGAWGCGVFSLQPQRIALLFRENILKSNYEGKIHFSIIDKDMLEQFKSVIIGVQKENSNKYLYRK